MEHKDRAGELAEWLRRWAATPSGCARLLTNGPIGPFFFVEKTVTGYVYLDMLENFSIPQIPSGFLFQQNGTPPSNHADVIAFLIGISRKMDWKMGQIAFPPRSPDLTPLDIFAWGLIKSVVYKQNLQLLKS
ncbi:DUF4817 domain-containing protein [Trichonephila clavipes]|nr:DUF4817 domain-containing protein [Trichonephila clavipes]